MRGMLLLDDPRYAQLNPGRWLAEADRLKLHIQYDETAALNGPPLLSALQARLYRLRSCCDWVCIMAEGALTAHAIILAAQLPVDRLVLLGGHALRSRGRINSFARRNLALVISEIVAVGMDARALRTLNAGLGYHSGGLVVIEDAAELWRKRETFLTAPFSALLEAQDCGK